MAEYLTVPLRGSARPSSFGFGQAGQNRGNRYAGSGVFRGSVPVRAPQGNREASSRERNLPERFDLDLFASGAIGQGVMLPARIAEQPLSILNQFSGGALSGSMGVVGGLGTEGFNIGTLIGGLGEGLERVGNFLPSIMNSHDAEILKRYGDQPDDFVLPDEANERRSDDIPNIPVLGNVMELFGVGTRSATIGEFKAELEKRNFNYDEETGSRQDWGVIVDRLRRDDLSTFEFGHAMVNDSAVVDLATRLVADPTNLLFATGLGAKALRLAAMAAPKWATKSASISRLSSLNPVAGVGYLEDMARVGARATDLAPPSEAALNILSGRGAANATLAGLGRALEIALKPNDIIASALRSAGPVGRAAAYMTDLRGYGSIGGYYRRGAILEAGTTILSGFTNPLQTLAQEIQENTPLSTNSVFVMATAFHMPVAAEAVGLKQAIRPLRERIIGARDLSAFSDILGREADDLAPEGPLARAAGMGGRRSKISKTNDFLQWLGKGDMSAGRRAFRVMINHIDRRIAMEKLAPSLRQAYESLDGFVSRGVMAEELIDNIVLGMRQRGELNTRSRVEAFRRWHEDVYERTWNADDTFIDRKREVAFSWDIDVVRNSWDRYLEVQQELAPTLNNIGQAIVGRAKTLTREQVDLMRAAVVAEMRDNKIDRSFLLEQIRRAPALIDEAQTYGRFWQDYLSVGSEITENVGLGQKYTGKVDAAELLSALDELREIAVPERELFHEAIIAEGKAPKDVDPDPQPRIVMRDAIKSITSLRQLEDVRTASHGFLKETARELSKLEREYNSRWTKNGRPRKGAKVDLPERSSSNPYASRIRSVTDEEYARAQSRGREILEEVERSPSSPLNHWDSRKERTGLYLYNRVLPEWGGATYNPRTGAAINPASSGEGPFATSVGETTTLPLSILDDKDAFVREVDKFIDSNRPKLEKEGVYIGLFHDVDNGRIDLNLSILQNTREDAIAAQTVLAREGGAYDYSSGEGVFGVKALVKDVTSDLRTAFNLSDDQALSVNALLDARAKVWSQETGREPKEWYDHNLAGIQRGGDIVDGALLQADPAKLEAFMAEPAPLMLSQWDLGGESPVVIETIGDQRIGIPGGIDGLSDGVWTIWDMWKLKSQHIDPNIMPNDVRAAFYQKLGRTHRRSLTDPLDVFNRMSFSMFSPLQSLVSNEALLAIFRVRNMEDVSRLASFAERMPDAKPGDIGFAIQKAFGLTGPTAPKIKGVTTNHQLGYVSKLASQFRSNPEWFTLRPDEDLLLYSERLGSLAAGAKMKVSTFGTMLADPLNFARGTIDAHVMKLLVNEGILSRGEVRWKKGSVVAPKPSEITYRLKDGTINPKVPPHLRDLPFEPPKNKVITYGSEYMRANEGLRQLMKKRGVEDMDLGIFQWMIWDMVRGQFEPHTLVYPGAYRLPKMEFDALNASYQEHVASGYAPQRKAKQAGASPTAMMFYQRDDLANIKGAMQLTSEGKAVLHGFEAADFSTAVHEVAHVFRRDLTEAETTTLRSIFGDDFEEGFATGFERYLREGKSPTAELVPLFEKFKTWLTDIYRVLRGSPLSKKIKPEVRAMYDRLLRDLDDDQLIAGRREAEMAAIREKRAELADRSAAIKEIDQRTNDILTTRLDPTLGRSDKLTPEQKREIQEKSTYLRENYPEYDLEAAPNLALRMELDDGALPAIALERTMLGRWLFEYGPLSKFSQFSDWLFSPVSSAKMAKDARQEVINKAMPLGVKPETIDGILKELREDSLKPTLGAERAQFFRGITGLTANHINDVARRYITIRRNDFGDPEIIPEGVEAWSKLEKVYGKDGFHRLLDASANSFIRRVDQRLRTNPKKVAPLEMALRDGYYAFQRTPAGSIHRLISKTLYHQFRFMSDLRWHALNRIEADMIALWKDGFRATRFGKEPAGEAPKSALEYHARTSDIGMPAINPNRPAVRGIGDEVLHNENGQFLFNRNLEPVLLRTFDKNRIETVNDVLDILPSEHPVIRALVQRFGPSRKGWARELDNMMYNFDHKGVVKTVRDETNRVVREDGWTPEEIRIMEPVIQRITELNQKTFDDLVQMHQGNPNRSRAERILNSYWLYWPITYQIKATKWLMSTLFVGAFGQRSNFGGAWTLARAEEMFKEKLATNEEYQQMLEENEDLWFAAQMLFPIVPWDIGVSLNRGVRYVGASIENPFAEDGSPFFARYEGIDDPGDFARKMLEIGPIYTAKLIQQVWAERSEDSPENEEERVNTPVSSAPTEFDWTGEPIR